MRARIRQASILLVAVAMVAAGCLPKHTPSGPKPPAPATPGWIHTHFHVRAAELDTPIAGATVAIQVAPGEDAASWRTGTTDAAGYVWVEVPATLRATHLRIAPPAGYYLASDQHVDLTPERDQTIRIEVHADTPPADRWFPFRCDITGIREPAIREHNSRTDAVASWIVPLYPRELRARIYAGMRARGYTHVTLDPAPKYGSWYPSGVLGVDQFRAAMQEALDYGLQPVTVWIPDNLGPDQAAWRRFVTPYLEDPAIRRMAQLNAVAWEANEWMTPADFETAATWLRPLLAPDALLFAHMTPDHAAMCTGEACEAPWWRRMAERNLLDGILLQLNPYATLDEQIDRARDFTERLVLGKHPAWPTKRADGRRLYVVAFEFDAYLQTRDRMTEDEGMRRGAALAALPGMSGYCDGGR